MDNRTGRFRRFAGELIVPATMLGFLAAYWWQAAGLSIRAISFPLTLSGILVILLAVQLVLSWRDISLASRLSPDDDEAPFMRYASLQQWIVPAQRMAILAIGAGLFFFWRELGGTLVIFVFSLASLLFLNERRWAVLVGLPVGLTVVLSYLFKEVLRVRFPDGLFALF